MTRILVHAPLTSVALHFHDMQHCGYGTLYTYFSKAFLQLVHKCTLVSRLYQVSFERLLILPW